jgi:hypothetical protein
MSNDNYIDVNYTDISSLDISVMTPNTSIFVYLNKDNPETLLTNLVVLEDNTLGHFQNYLSCKEFATTSMKETLTLYVKRKVVSLYPEYYEADDAKLHGFISKLSYAGIQYVAEHVVEFATAFKENKLKETLSIPRGLKHRS